MKVIALAAILVAASIGEVLAWGEEGHAIVAEIAQRRLNDAARAAVSTILANASPVLKHASLASFASWPDDYRPSHTETSNWHFVDIPLKENAYDPARDCKPEARGDCIIAELDRLKTDLVCKTGEEQFKALKFAVHFVGDIQQPLHAVLEELGGNNIFVEVQMKGQICTGTCVVPTTDFAKFHDLWDFVLIQKTVFAWGSYVERLEGDWLKSPAANGADGGTPTDWALEAHKAAQVVWAARPANNILTDTYYQKALPILDRQLGVGGLRLARYLNEVFASPPSCPKP